MSSIAEAIDQRRTSFHRPAPAAGRSRLRRSPPRPQRPDRQAAGAHRALPRHGRRRRRRQARAVARTSRSRSAAAATTSAGRATIDDGLMIDLSPMKGIHVDAAARTVRAQGGVLWKEFNRETQLHGLATTGGVVGTHRHRRPDARRRPRLADAEVRPGARQPAVGGDRDGRRPGRARERRREPGSVLGDPRRRRQLRHRRVARIRRCTRSGR